MSQANDPAGTDAEVLSGVRERIDEPSGLVGQASSWADAAHVWASWQWPESDEGDPSENATKDKELCSLLVDFPGCRLRKIDLTALSKLNPLNHHASVQYVGPTGIQNESSPAAPELETVKSVGDAPSSASRSNVEEMSLVVIEDVMSSGPGGRIWDAAVVLGSWILEHYGKKGMNDMAVIELGAGIGLVGMVCAKLGAEVSVTDKESLLPLIGANIRHNAEEQVERGLLWAERLEWGQKLTKRMKRRKIDLIVASDVVGCGDQALFSPLMKSILQLSDPSSSFVMAYKPRATFEQEFFEEANQHFTVKLLHRVELPHQKYSESYSAPIDIFEMKLIAGTERQRDTFDFEKAGYVFIDD